MLTPKRLLKQAMLLFGYPTRQLRRRSETLVLFYHGVGAHGIAETELARQFRYLARHFEPIFASEIGQPARSGRMRVAITFDDGLRSTWRLALPLLQRYSLKATWFVLPGAIGWLWTEELRERLRGHLASGAPAPIEGRSLRSPADIDRLVEQLKALSHADFVAALGRIRAQTRFAPDQAWLDANSLMTPEELRALPESVIELGAHTINHFILPSLDQAGLEAEIGACRQRLEALLDRPIRTFSYPNGDFDRRCLRVAADHYEFAFTTDSAIGGYPAPAELSGNRHAINRLHGPEHHLDLPFAMLRFLRAGGGFGPAAV
jgi:peptidoglycan/xylan/chitin deacetylase (PgdA/CDA1 family)